jgi:hypothetical protein
LAIGPWGAALAVVSIGACSLIVGDPHGRLPAPDASEATDASEGTDASQATDTSDASDAGVLAPTEASAACDAADCHTTIVPSTCALGGCNGAGGACTSPGQQCYCDDDSQCTGGKCVPTKGQNDQSCAGATCTGTGASDGFGCELAACTVTTFGYAPSNFTPATYTPPSAATTDCNATYSSTAHAFTGGGCTGIPTVVENVAQPGGGHAVDILLFKALTIASTSTLTLVGANPVILAVYGNAEIHGVIDASGYGSTAGAGGVTCPVSGADAGTGSWEPGAGGGGQAAAGGAGGGSMGIDGGAPGTSQPNGTAPLSGGCAGEMPFLVNSGFTPALGAGGGGVELAVAGVIDISTGTVKANGGNGGNGESGKCETLYPPQNGTGGAGGGSGGNVLLEGATVAPGTIAAQGGAGGDGGVAPSPNNQVGGAGGAGGASGASGAPGNPGIRNGSAPSGCSWGGYWSGGGGGGGAGGYVKVTSAGGACPCTTDTDCSTKHCSNVSSQCTEAATCTGTTTAGTYDSLDCEILTSVATP